MAQKLLYYLQALICLSYPFRRSACLDLIASLSLAVIGSHELPVP